MAKVNRRQFLNTSAKTAAALGVSSTVARRALGANERIRIAVAGIHGRGTGLINDFTARKDCEVAVICDPDTRLFDAKIKHTEGKQGKAPKAVADMRRVIEDKSIDALVIATPDHWHALGTVLACQAGKDVYVEKPVSYNLEEGQRMVAAARKHDRVVQVGTQRRSATHLPEMLEIIRSGVLGHIGFVRTWIIDIRDIIGRKPDGPTPKGVEYDLWLGPAAKRDFNINHFHYQWHWLWEYGTGQLGNNGIHALDLARAILGFGLPNRVTSGGGINYFQDDHQTPDTHIVTYEYPRMTLMWEHRMRDHRGIEGAGWGIGIHGDKGSMIVYSDSFKLYDKEGRNLVNEVKGNNGEHEHVANFVECMRSRRRPNCDIEEGHMSAALCHLGNIAWRTRKNLAFDAKTMRFDDDEANKLRSRTYREGFVLPKKV